MPETRADVIAGLRARSKGLAVGAMAIGVLVLAGIPGGGSEVLTSGASNDGSAEGSTPAATQPGSQPGTPTSTVPRQGSSPGAAQRPGTPRSASGTGPQPGPGQVPGTSATTGSTAGSAASNGRGVTDTTFALGVIYPKNAGAASANLGVSGGAGGSSDPVKQAQAVIAYVNGTGGVGSRRIAPTFQEFDYNNLQANPGTVACTRFTQDVTVFAVITGAGGNTECLAKKGVVWLGVTGGISEDNYKSFPDLVYGTSDFSSDRQTRLYIDGTVASGLYTRLPAGATGAAKIGVVTFSLNYKSYQPIVDATFGKHGLKVAAYGKVATDSSNIGTIVNDFKAKGITHVITPGYGPALFMNYAESQNYRPLYGLASSMQPTTTASVVPPTQLAGSVAVGWQPVVDVKEEDRPALGANEALCQKLMRDAGQPYDAVAAGYCDALFVLQRATRGASVVNRSVLRRGYEGLGEWDSVLTFRSFMSPSRPHDAGAGYRLAPYQQGCLCYRYEGPIRPY